MQEFEESTTFLGTEIIDYLRAIINKIDKKLGVISHKPTFRISKYDYNNLNTALVKLEQSVDDVQFAYDKRAIQTGLDDLVVNINLAVYNTRNLANVYNFNKMIWTLNEIGLPSTVIEDIQRKKEEYRAKHHDDPFKLSRKWFKKMSAGFRLICKQCGHIHTDVDLIECQLPDKSSRRNPE